MKSPVAVGRINWNSQIRETIIIAQFYNTCARIAQRIPLRRAASRYLIPEMKYVLYPLRTTICEIIFAIIRAFLSAAAFNFLRSNCNSLSIYFLFFFHRVPLSQLPSVRSLIFVRPILIISRLFLLHYFFLPLSPLPRNASNATYF